MNNTARKAQTQIHDVSMPENNSDQEGILRALNRVQALIEFNLDGTVITANENFLNTLTSRPPTTPLSVSMENRRRSLNMLPT